MFPDVEGSSENVDEEVLFCLKLENGKYVNVIYCELGYILSNIRSDTKEIILPVLMQ